MEQIHKEWYINDVIHVIECHYTELVEISVYIPAVLPNANEILVGVVNRPFKGAKWFAHTNQVKSIYKGRIKSRALDAVVSHARSMHQDNQKIKGVA